MSHALSMRMHVHIHSNADNFQYMEINQDNSNIHFDINGTCTGHVRERALLGACTCRHFRKLTLRRMHMQTLSKAHSTSTSRQYIECVLLL